MKPKDITDKLRLFQERVFPEGPSFNFESSKPWSFIYPPEGNTYVPFRNDTGIYIFSKPIVTNETDWNIPMEDNNSDIWYIGKSDGDIGGRVWSHMGLIYEPGSRILCSPRFKYNEWHKDARIPEDIRTFLDNGNIVVYTIKITPINRQRFEPQVIEKFLLACYYKSEGHLPPLNKDI